MKAKITMRQLASDEQPREKILTQGAGAMSNTELLAIILRSGADNENAVELSRRILNDCGNDLNNLAAMQVSEIISKYKGVGLAKATAIVSAMELSRRRIVSSGVRAESIKSSREAYSLLWNVIGDLGHEEFWAIFLSRSNRVIAKLRIASGGWDCTVVDIRLLLKKCLEYKAVGLIVAHNHPSGNLSPSIQDKMLTKRISNASDLMDIKLQDHLIISRDGYYSFLDEGEM